MAQLRLILWGPPQIEVDGQPVGTDRRKAVALLVYLAVTGTAHSREALATLFWPESDQSRALAYLRRTLWEVNQMVGEGTLLVDRSNIVLDPAAELSSDVQQFWDRTADLGDLRALAEGVALVTGDFLQGFTLRDAPAFDEWHYYQADACKQRLGESLQRLTVALAAAGDLDTAVTYGRRWLALDPLHEPPVRELMRLYGQQGQKTIALRVYERYRQQLAAELDTTPDQELIALYQQIRSGRLPARETTAPPAARPEPALTEPHLSVTKQNIASEPGSARLSNVPVPATPFVGRRQELDEITALVANPTLRLLTLIGPGGSGKTRLALAAAMQVLPAFEDGVIFVPLATLTAADDIVTAITRALRLCFFKEGDLPQEQLYDYLRPKRLLLLLDNLEHLLVDEIAVDLLQALISEAPHLTILVTSRMRLGIQAEHLFMVSGMRTPAVTQAAAWLIEHTGDVAELTAPYSALQLFAACGQRTDPSFQITEDNLLSVVRICQLVDGMPLALELAAGWLMMLSLTEIEGEIRQSLDFLESELHDLPPRQRSMRAVFNYSWQLLSALEKEVLPGLTIFQGGFTREAAQQVTGASPRILLGLMHKSLIRRDSDGRFSMHELLRQYAAENLEDDPDRWMITRDRHSVYYLALLAREGQRMQGPQQRQGFDAVEEEIENIRASWLWAIVQQRYAVLLPTLETLAYYHQVRSTLFPSFVDLLEIGMEDLKTAANGENMIPGQPTAAQTLYARMLAFQAWVLGFDYGGMEATAMSQKVLDLVEEWQIAPQMGLSLILVAITRASSGEEETGIHWVYRALDLLRQAENPWALAFGCNMAGACLHHAGVRDGVKELLLEGSALSRELGDDLLLAYNLTTLAWVLTHRREFAEALQIDQECQALFEKVGDRAGAANNLSNIGTIYDVGGNYREAAAQYRHSGELFGELGRRGALAANLGWESQMWQRVGEYERALALRQQALGLFQELDSEHGSAWSFFELGEIYRLLGNEKKAAKNYQKSYEQFSRLQLTHGLAFYFRAKGRQALADGDIQLARESLAHSVSLAEDNSLFYWNLAYTLCEEARVALTVRAYDRAAAKYYEALRLSDQWASLGITLVILSGFAELWVDQEEYERAAALAALVLEHPATWAESKPGVTKSLAAAREHLDATTYQNALQQGQQRELAAVIAALMKQAPA